MRKNDFSAAQFEAFPHKYIQGFATLTSKSIQRRHANSSDQETGQSLQQNALHKYKCFNLPTQTAAVLEQNFLVQTRADIESELQEQLCTCITVSFDHVAILVPPSQT